MFSCSNVPFYDWLEWVIVDGGHRSINLCLVLHTNPLTFTQKMSRSADFEGFNLKKIFITNPVSTMECNGVNNVLPHRGGL